MTPFSGRRCLIDPKDMTPTVRLDALVWALAEGFLYLAAHELLEEVARDRDGVEAKESVRKGAESPCFQGEDRLSFSPDGGVECELDDPE